MLFWPQTVFGLWFEALGLDWTLIRVKHACARDAVESVPPRML